MNIPLLRLTACLLALSTSLQLSAQQVTDAQQVTTAQKQTNAPLVPSQLTGPPPSQIATAHKVFLTTSSFDPNFPIDSARAYNEVYTRLQTWGHYQLVPSAEQADLVLELHGISPITGYAGADGQVASYTTPAFQMNIIDPRAARAIWTISSPVVLSGRKKTYDHWVQLSENNLVSRLQVLSGQALSAAQTADLTTVPKGHGATVAIVVVSSVVLLGVGGGLLLHHFYENSLADQKASQDAFCKANNIPLSMCTGG